MENTCNLSAVEIRKTVDNICDLVKYTCVSEIKHEFKHIFPDECDKSGMIFTSMEVISNLVISLSNGKNKC